MSSWEVVLVLGGIPLAVLVVLGLLTLGPNFARMPRYRPGQEWNHPPVWWTASPPPPRPGRPGPAPPGPGPEYGGAHGDW